MMKINLVSKIKFEGKSKRSYKFYSKEKTSGFNSKSYGLATCVMLLDILRREFGFAQSWNMPFRMNATVKQKVKSQPPTWRPFSSPILTHASHANQLSHLSPRVMACYVQGLVFLKKWCWCCLFVIAPVDINQTICFNC